MPDPFPLREISVDEVAWRNTVVGTNRVVRWGDDVSRMELSFHDGPIVSAERSVHVVVGPARFWIGFSDWDRVPRVAAFLEGGSLAAMPLEIVPVVLEAVFAHELDLLSDRASARAEIVSAGAAPESDSNVQIGVRLRDGEGAMVEGAVCGDAAAMRFLRYLVEMADLEPSFPTDGVSLAAGVRIGGVGLTVDELSGLKVHDVVVLDETSYLSDKEAVLEFSPELVWRASISEGEAVLIERTESTTPASETNAPSIAVAAEAGRVECSVDALAKLDAESTLPVSGAGSITLTADRKAFACGELVQIGERVGVRVLSLSSPLKAVEPPPAEGPDPLDVREV